ncbi:GspE/PulE family protein [Niveibacterium sp. SC-1]|uniref:GspE/PulE family protein n=1 Tax=Niveibacterium sp. SC-1 TaxID=3135646 RepID=UPI00311FF9C1
MASTAAKPASPVLNPAGPLHLQDIIAALVMDGLLDLEEAKKLRATLRSAKSTDLHPLVAIASARIPDRRNPERPLAIEPLTQWLAGKLELPYLKIDPMKINVASVTEVVSLAYAQRHRILPISADANEVVIACAEPHDKRWIADLSGMLRRQVRMVFSNPLDINRYRIELYQVQRSVLQARKNDREDAQNLLNLEQLVELGKSGELNADNQHVVHIVDWLLQYAFEQRASDIHLEPRRDAGRMRFRIDGVMHQVFELPASVLAAVTARIKILGRMDVAEKRRPQDGRIKTRLASGRELELRLSTMPTAFGEKIVMRIFDPDIVVKAFSQLGFNNEEEAIWRRMVERPNGIVLVTGPTGSGKTTTLYSTLKHLARPELNVCTVEDPIEMVAPEFNQMQVHTAIDLTFAAGVRTLLRQDPDIIMVGEIRDLETAQMAIQASLTGHLLLSTLHTNDAPSAVTRLLDLGVPHYLVQSTLTGVVAQRLLRTLCPHCKEPGALDLDAWRVLVHGWDLPTPDKVMAPVGCLECRNTGFLGRTGIYEMMRITPKLRALVSEQFDLEAFGRAALTEGMRPLRLSAALQVARGVTTVTEALSVLPNDEA